MCRWEPGGKRASWSVPSTSPSGCRLAPPGGKCWGSGDASDPDRAFCQVIFARALSRPLHRTDAVILAITDVKRAALDEDAVWPREFASKRIAVWAVAALPGTDHRRNDSISQIDPSNDMVFRVGYIKRAYTASSSK